ncbi:MAG: leucyl/phenylalanyl-tRNA--protein transferase [Flavobacteriales bacterium]|nr:MAG: leucyl/phenylalanyl-tRNA--protein transferase [Flavobacteriales bacterium]
MHILTKKLWFPPVHTATPQGIVAIGGDLSPERLLLAYKSGIFPWYNKGEPIVWYSPKNRMVLFFKDLKISKSMRQILKKGVFKITFNQNFKEVIRACKNIYRKGQGGTWITDEMEEAYIKLHQLGYAKSVEVWLANKLVGGLYGVDLETVFCGESMFSKVSNTSKIALIYLAKKLQPENYKLIDCQVYNKHLASLGAMEIPRNKFLTYLPKKIS